MRGWGRKSVCSKYRSGIAWNGRQVISRETGVQRDNEDGEKQSATTRTPHPADSGQRRLPAPPHVFGTPLGSARRKAIAAGVTITLTR